MKSKQVLHNLFDLICVQFSYMKNILATQLITIKAPIYSLQYPLSFFYFTRLTCKVNLTQYLSRNIRVETSKSTESQLTSNPNSCFQAYVLNTPHYTHAQQISHSKIKIYTVTYIHRVYLEVPFQSYSVQGKKKEKGEKKEGEWPRGGGAKGWNTNPQMNLKAYY